MVPVMMTTMVVSRIAPVVTAVISGMVVATMMSVVESAMVLGVVFLGRIR
ncbi:MAG: hypothetical protein ACYC9S_12105 [Leptospirales bacterium]